MSPQVRFPGSAGYGVKAVSREGTERLMDAAIKYALAKNSKSVTLVHKGAPAPARASASGAGSGSVRAAVLSASTPPPAPWSALLLNACSADALASLARQATS